MKIAVNRFAKRLLPVMLIASLLATQPSFVQSSSAGSTSSDSVVVLTPTQADSLIAALDYYEMRTQLLQVDLDECRALARLDSIQIHQMVEDQPKWYDNIARNPFLWLLLGVYVGGQLAK